ncbi:AfsR/SARP family transcriptional regulator [Plantactinospora endophytica]|uniref:SARP family transcriptional regulator n=1 Tax=Plantactinospora endophytica TaxID=673535 RepID=A0ABQ4EBX4_9ACTN|nr:AfsR/SARP family transcriptional regulator [Plantactinospora endophytica]GIG92235.1 SARP family transcriptional regulator [Plantactinospora endophytica]
MRFGILGPLEIHSAHGPVRIGSHRQRALLATLLVHPAEAVGVDELVEAIWGPDGPENPRAAVHTCVTRLRRSLDRAGDEPVRIERQMAGYRLAVDPEDVDLGRFETALRRAEAAREAVDPATEVAALRAALGLWRGEPLIDVGSDFLDREVVPRLVELRLAALERRIDLDLRAPGDQSAVVAELHGLTGRHPLRERFWVQLMRGLAASGRRGEAFAVYREVRRRLREELGVDPGEEVQQVHLALLRGDPAPADDATPAAPAAPPWTVSCQLPLDVRDFVGRDTELKQLLDELRQPSGGGPAVVMISGPPGVGKSALGIRAAHQASADFPDGQWYVRLHGAGPDRRDAAHVLAELLRTAGVNPAGLPDGTDERAALLRSRLADRRVLLLLDDAADAAQVAPLLPGRPGSAVLLTSRSDLGGMTALYGARRLQLGLLVPDEAHQLLRRIVGPDQLDAREAAELADLCGRLPLALRIVAANLAGRPSLDPARYVRQLAAGDRLAKLTADGDQSLTVRSAFDLSYAGSDEAQRRAFRLLGLVPGPDVSVPGAAALFGLDEEHAGRLLDQLAAANLVERHTMERFRLHDLLRLYAADRAGVDDPAEEQAAALRRLFDWYLHGANDATIRCYPMMYPADPPAPPPGLRTPVHDSDRAALDWLDAERAGICSAVQHAALHGPTEYSWLLTYAVRPDMLLRYHLAELDAASGAALDAARRTADERAEAMMLLTRGTLALVTNRFQEALSHLAAAQPLAEAHQQAELAASIANIWGLVHLNLGELAPAAAQFDRSLRWVDVIGESARVRTISTLINLGVARLELAELDRARTYFSRALELAETHGALFSAATALVNLAGVELELGNLDSALALFEDSLGRYQQCGARPEEAIARQGLATVHRDAGRYDRAEEQGRLAVELTEQIGHRRYAADSLATLASVYLATDRPALALAHYARGHDLAVELGYPRVEIESLAALALLEAVDPDTPGPAVMEPASARPDAVTRARAAGLRLMEAKALVLRSRLRLRQGRGDEAADDAELALRLHRESGCRLGQAQALVLLGEITTARGRPEATGYWREAADLFTGIGSPFAAQAHALLARHAPDPA